MDKKSLRERITEEDTLLGSRTLSFLLANGFLIAALGISSVEFERKAIGVLGILMAIIWLCIGWQMRRAITALHELYHDKFPDDEINKTVFSRIMWKRKLLKTIFGPTELITGWLPLVVLLVWLSINGNMHFGQQPDTADVARASHLLLSQKPRYSCDAADLIVRRHTGVFHEFASASRSERDRSTSGVGCQAAWTSTLSLMADRFTTGAADKSLHRTPDTSVTRLAFATGSSRKG